MECRLVIWREPKYCLYPHRFELDSAQDQIRRSISEWCRLLQPPAQVTTILRTESRDVWQFLELPQVPRFSSFTSCTGSRCKGCCRRLPRHLIGGGDHLLGHPQIGISIITQLAHGAHLGGPGHRQHHIDTTSRLRRGSGFLHQGRGPTCYPSGCLIDQLSSEATPRTIRESSLRSSLLMR